MAKTPRMRAIGVLFCTVGCLETDALSLRIVRYRDEHSANPHWPVTPRQIAMPAAATRERHNRTATNQRRNTPSDSIEEFQKDVSTVLQDLRGSVADPMIPALFRRDDNGGPSFSKTWTLSDWERHSSRRRYLDYLWTFRRSRMLRSLLPQLTVLASWSLLTVMWLVPSITSRLHIPLAPLSIVFTFVAALLTLRSNQGLDRLAQGRAAMRMALWNTRHLAQLLASSVYFRNPYLALKALRHVAIFVWMLKNFMREDEMNISDIDILNAMLDPKDAAFVSRHRKRPVAVVTRLLQIIAHLSDQLPIAEQLKLKHAIQRLNECITTCERIRASPIPPLYTAHTDLLLTCYLFLLPLALQGSGMLHPVVTFITTMVVGYAMLGLDEISHILEQPFKLIPLYQQAKHSMMDVADAIVEEPPALTALTE
ncbi:hypothetical protein MPSEU_000107100 [Mayamaea pseudoterrestris]|nr:hypothetical protein MPSEU_000107100 [Mayamaea pseudoterrestris]